MVMVEQQMRGVPVAEIAAGFGVSEMTVYREVKRGVELGYADRVRDKLLATLDSLPTVYADVLAQTPETLHKHSRGYTLKVNVAKDLATGLGVFKTESTKNVKNTLELIAEESAPAEPAWQDRTAPRVRFQPETVEGELLSADEPSPSTVRIQRAREASMPNDPTDDEGGD